LPCGWSNSMQSPRPNLRPAAEAAGRKGQTLRMFIPPSKAIAVPFTKEPASEGQSLAVPVYSSRC
jgi:hypothetical protein